MPVYKRGVRGGKVQVSEYDTSLMQTLNGIFPTDRAFHSHYLERAADCPEGKLRDFYHTKDNGALVRKIFTTFLKDVLLCVASGKGEFIIPNRGAKNPSIGINYMSKDEIRVKKQNNRLLDINLFTANYKVPYIAYTMSPTSRRPPLRIYINKKLYETFKNTINSGKHFSVIPRDIDYFMPKLCEEFSYIKPKKLRSLIIECFRLIHKQIKFGEEIRCLDNDGEVRFYRNLGHKHDRVMKTVKKARLTRERNKRINGFKESIS